MITCWGSRLPAVKTISSATLNFQLKRETAKPMNEASSSVRSTAGTATIRVFR
jgi:hypothetical protein